MSRKTKRALLLVPIDRSEVDGELLALLDAQAKAEGKRSWLVRGIVSGCIYACLHTGKPDRRFLKAVEAHELAQWPAQGGVQ